MKLSALLCVHNEENIIGACLERLTFCDDIVVMADRCTDRTVEICQSMGANVIQGSWPIEGVRKNEGLTHVKNEWVLEIDADEHVDETMAQEIEKVIKADATDWHFIPILNYIGDTPIKYGWGCYIGVNKAKRLFRRTHKKCKEQIIHPSIEITGRQGHDLTSPIHHYVDKDISDMWARLDRYTDAHAMELMADGKIDSFGRNIVRGLGRFFKSYVSRKGYKEGQWGLMLGLFAFLYPVMSYFKARLERDAS